MNRLALLIAIFAALVVLAVYLDHIAFDPFAAYRTDPRDLVDRAHRWGDEDGGEDRG